MYGVLTKDCDTFTGKHHYLQFGSAVLLLSFNKKVLLLQTRNIEFFVPVEMSSGAGTEELNLTPLIKP